MAIISSIGTALPKYRHPQKDIFEYMKKALELDADASRRLSLMYSRSGIENRYSVLPEFNLQTQEFALFDSSKDTVVDISNRMEVYHTESLELAKEAILNTIPEGNLSSITHLITVSCTGLSAPGLDIALVESLGLNPAITRTSVNFMGCYAALHGLKLANAFCESEPNSKVIVVCVELCTLHFQNNTHPDFLTSGLLFGDGAAACLLESNQDKKGLLIKGFYSKVALQGKYDMAWELSSTGFLMTLSSYIPKLVESEIANLLEAALEKMSLQIDDIDAWAIHPGGKDILTASAKALNLDKSDLSKSYQVLNDIGNISSPTILFVLKLILEDDTCKGNIFSAAFGPGITLESLILNKN
jgi:predicted naringenin-chalcone synthase